VVVVVVVVVWMVGFEGFGLSLCRVLLSRGLTMGRAGAGQEGGGVRAHGGAGGAGGDAHQVSRNEHMGGMPSKGKQRQGGVRTRPQPQGSEQRGKRGEALQEFERKTKTATFRGMRKAVGVN
jgi:hypothetical protein